MENLPIDGKQSKHEQWLLQSLLRQGGFWPFVRQHLQAEEFQTPQYRYLYAELLQFPDEKLQTFDPLSIEHSAPELFRSVMLLLAEEIPLHEFKVSLEQIKKRNLAIQDQELRSGGNEEEKLLSGKYKREEEKKLQEILANLPTL